MHVHPYPTAAISSLNYVPVVGNIANLVFLFQKHCLLPFMKEKTVEQSHHFRWLRDTNSFRFILLSIPILGNLMIAIYDLAKYVNTGPQKKRKAALAAVKQNGWALAFASENLKNDREIVLAAVKKDGLALSFASENLKSNREVALAAVQQNPLALRFASENLKNNREIVLAACNQNPEKLSDSL